MLGTIVIRGYDLLWRTPISQILPNEAVKTAARTSIHPSLCLYIEAEPGSAGCGEHWAGHVPTFSGFFGEGTRDERRKSEEGPKGARLAEFPDPALRD